MKNIIRKVLVVCICLVSVICLALCTGCNNRNNNKEPINEIQQQEESHLVVECNSRRGFTLRSGVATVASDGTTSQKIIATITPANLTKNSLTWSVAFNDPNSDWASGKTVTDYVTVSVDTDSDTICTVTCLQAFGEQIIVKCQSVDYPGIYATATVDYVRKVTTTTLTMYCDDNYFDTNPSGIMRVRVLDDADTYTFYPGYNTNPVCTIARAVDLDFSWQISTDEKGLLGEARNVIAHSVTGYDSLSVVNTPTKHTDKKIELSLDFLCEEIFGKCFTNTEAYVSSSEVDNAKNVMRNAVIAGLEYCYQKLPGYLFTVTINCSGFSSIHNIALSTVDVSVPLESISLSTSAIEF